MTGEMELSERTHLVARQLLTSLGKKTMDRIDAVDKRTLDLKGTAASSTSPTVARPVARQGSSLPAVVIGGFNQDIPRGVLELGWTIHIRQHIEKAMSFVAADVEAPLLLSSLLQVNSLDLQARYARRTRDRCASPNACRSTSPPRYSDGRTCNAFAGEAAALW